MTQSIIVSILMPTYNHEKYIAKAIDSALAQKCSFNFELLIHDDCSTDSTLKIAREYAEKYPGQIRLFTENQNCGLIKSYKKLMEKARGKYVAILESDDLWINEQKLQKQVDFLETNEDFGLVAGDIIEIDQNGNEINKGSVFNTHIREKTRWYEELLGNNGVRGACSVMFCKKDFDSYCNMGDWVNLNFKTFDQPAWLSISFYKKCAYFNEKLAAYRVLETSISNAKNSKKSMDFCVGVADIEEYIVGRFGTGELSEQAYNQKICLNMTGKALKRKQRKTFVKYAKMLKPLSLKQKIMHSFPNLYYWQFTTRHR